jgi:hypothetical protein
MLSSLTFQRAQPYLAAAAVGVLIGLLNLSSPLIALGAVFAVTAVLIVLRYPIFVCYMMILAIPLTAGVTRGKLVPLLRPNEVLLLLSFAVTLFVLMTTKDRWDNLRKASAVFIPFGFMLFGTILIPVVYHALSNNPASITAMFNVFSPLKFFMLFLVFAIIPNTDKHWHHIILGMLVGSAIVSVVGLLQAANSSLIRELIATWYASDHSEASLSEEGGRITSLMGGWNALGMLLSATLAIGWAALMIPEMRPYRLIIIPSMLVSFICLVASGSFAGFGGMLFSIILIELLTSPLSQTIKRFSLAFGLAAGGLLIALPVIWPTLESRLLWQFNDGSESLLPQTFVYRFWIWSDVFWPEIVRNPFFGTSLEIYQSYRWWAAESHYISVLFRFGVVGLIGHMLWATLMLVWLVRQLSNPSPLPKMMAATAFALLVMLLITSFTNEVFMFTGIIDYLWVLFALVANRKDKVTL